MSEYKIYLGDCLDIMPRIPSSSIDLILCDLPYKTSVVHKWNKTLPMNKLWKEYERVIKDNGVICLFGTEPFTSELYVKGIYDMKKSEQDVSTYSDYKGDNNNNNG